MTAGLDELDEKLMIAIVGFDVDGMPVGPMVTPVILFHRLRDSLNQAGDAEFRHVPPAVVRLLRESDAAANESMGKTEAKSRINKICQCITAQISL